MSLAFDALVAAVVDRLAERQVDARVIGAAALAGYGVTRGTRDLDLLVVDPVILAASWWSGLSAPGFGIDIRRGDPDDPLIGVVRFEARDQDAVNEEAEQLDLVVTPGRWSAGMVQRAGAEIRCGHRRLAAVRASDLILLKLYAGGPRDGWDIDALLTVTSDSAALIAEVEAGLSDMPARCSRMWGRVVERR